MSKQIFGMLSLSRVFCMLLFIALNARADQADPAQAQSLTGGSTTLGNLKIVCGEGLLPLSMDGNLKGAIEVPRGKISFFGKYARIAYCGYPSPSYLPALVAPDENAVSKDVTSSIKDLKGLHLSCVNGQLPLVLAGSAQGSLRTSKGIVNLHGDHNKVVVCLNDPRK